MPSRPPPPPPPRRGSTTGTHRIQREGGTSVRAAPNEFEHFVRINPAGAVVAAHGSAERLGALSSYVCGLADLVGQLLDLGPCRALEATYTGGRLITVREPDGSIVGLKPQPLNTAPAVRPAVRNEAGGSG